MPGSSAHEVRLYHRLQMAAHTVAKFSDQHMRDVVGLTTAQVSVLAVLSGRPNVSQREVAEELGVNESAVTGMITRLASAGLVERVANERDRRAWVLRLAPEGRVALRRASRAFQRVNDALDEALPPAAVVSMADELDRVVSAVRRRLDGASGARSGKNSQHDDAEDDHRADDRSSGD